jgi:hypothetical protein
MAKFLIKSDLPISDQRKIDALEAIPSAQRTVSQAAYLTALAPYRTNLIISVGEDGLINSASGLTVPTGLEGFRKGAVFIKTDAATNGQYQNTGDATTSVWSLVDVGVADDMVATVPLSAAQIIALSVTPVTLVAAVTGSVIVVDEIVLTLTTTATVFTGGTPLEFRYTNGSGAKVTADIADTVITAAAGTSRTILKGVAATGVVTSPIIVTNATTPFAAGTGTGVVTVRYHLV